MEASKHTACHPWAMHAALQGYGREGRQPGVLWLMRQPGTGHLKVLNSSSLTANRGSTMWTCHDVVSVPTALLVLQGAAAAVAERGAAAVGMLTCPGGPATEQRRAACGCGWHQAASGRPGAAHHLSRSLLPVSRLWRRRNTPAYRPTAAPAVYLIQWRCAGDSQALPGLGGGGPVSQQVASDA